MPCCIPMFLDWGRPMAREVERFPVQQRAPREGFSSTAAFLDGSRDKTHKTRRSRVTSRESWAALQVRTGAWCAADATHERNRRSVSALDLWYRGRGPSK